MLILFPSDYFDIKKIDVDYAQEYDAVCRIPEFKPIMYNYDGFVDGKPLKLYPNNFYTGECIYRGWMLTPEQYATLYGKLDDEGIRLINTPTQYECYHCFPNAYEHVKNHTPKMLYFPTGTPIKWELVNETFSRFMIKDAVKSVKGHSFPSFFETPVTADEMNLHMENFRNLRGKLFTGGIVIKEYVDLKRYGSITNEYRAFYLKHNLLSLSKNSNNLGAYPSPPQQFVEQWATLSSNYFTVDFGELNNGEWIVIETGDGQVSGLSPGQFAFKYYDDMRFLLSQPK